MNRTNIEYLDAAWNPTHGCTPIATGCKNCWAKRMAQRQRGRNGYPADNPFSVTCRPDRLDQPLRWKKPKRIGVSFMGDLFHDEVPDEFIARVWQTMCRCQPHHAAFTQYPPHTFLVLTKRPERASEFVQGWEQEKFCGDYVNEHRNIHVGFSASTQADLDDGIENLMRTPAAVRFLSLEPLVEPISLRRYLADSECGNCGWMGHGDHDDAEGGLKRVYRGDPEWGQFGETDDPSDDAEWVCPSCGAPEEGSVMDYFPFYNQMGPDPYLGSVIVGGESGPGARPMDPNWVRAIRDDCQAAGVPFYFKQWGGKQSGRELDGRTWNELP